MMKTDITHAYPDQHFWDAYTKLWDNSAHRSVFQAPHFIRFLAKKFEQSLAVYQYCKEGQLMGVAFFRNDNGTHKLLSEIKADYNFVTLHKHCTEEETRDFFRIFFQEVKKQNWTLILNYQPSWASYLKVLEQEGKASGLFLAVSKHSVCPHVEAETPKGVLDWFNGLKNFRYYVNRLKKQQSAVFEVFTGDEELDQWADEFCDCHVKRWNSTATPSRYHQTEMQELSREVFRAWAKDNLLTRFSIRIGEERVAFNIALRQGDALVGHAQAYDPDFAKYSPGKALMYFIGEWMSQNGMVKIDFGKGGEAYKAGMTNGEMELYKIFVSKYSNLSFVFKSKLEQAIRSSPGFIAIYRGKIKPKIQETKIRVKAEASRLLGSAAAAKHYMGNPPPLKDSVLYALPDQHFWEAYENLWKNSLHQPAFQSPRFLQFLAKKFEKNLVIFQCWRGEQLVGAAFFRKENGVYKFLSDVMADHNFFVLHKQCTREEVEAFFEKFHRQVEQEKWALILKNQPMWAAYTDVFLQSGKSGKLFQVISKHSVCPVFEEKTPEALFERLNNKQGLRYSAGRLEKQLGAVFEIFTGDEDLDDWVKGFCQLHIKRWKDTGSPSKYENEEMQAFLLHCLKAWIADGVSVRFSVKTGQERIGYVIGLVQENSLIYHSIAHDANYHKYSPGKALIHVIGQWMQQRQLNVLDFGEGDEEYKYSFTNKELRLDRVFISNNLNLPFIVRAILESKLRENARLRKLYRGKIKPKLLEIIARVKTEAVRLFGKIAPARQKRGVGLFTLAHEEFELAEYLCLICVF